MIAVGTEVPECNCFNCI